jgi:AAA+ superfamily predicted ATPase
VDRLKVERAPERQPEPIPVVQPRGELTGLLSVSYPEVRLSHLALAGQVRRRLDMVLEEERQEQKLRAHGLAPRRKLLLVGPPGTGKTMTAAALAGELHWPLFKVQLDGLITKFMGDTAAKLRLIFDTLAKRRGVYLFDEFDAIGKRRDAQDDVGEIRRVLNSFLQFLEEDTSLSLIVAATNHVELLDPALFRRFDESIEYGLPDEPTIETLLRDRLVAYAPEGFAWAPLAACGAGLSHAEITRAADDALREAVLANRTKVTEDALRQAFEDRRRARRG